MIFRLGPATAYDLISYDFYTAANRKHAPFQAKASSPGRSSDTVRDFFVVVLFQQKRNFRDFAKRLVLISPL